jgi:hypothetical protein
LKSILKTGKTFEISEEEANENGESFKFWKNSYEYAFTNQNHRLNCSIDGIVAEVKRNHSVGRIVPNIYVGTLTLYVTDSTQEVKICNYY